MKKTNQVEQDENGTGRSSASLVAVLRQDIRAGSVAVGDFLPPVRTLSKKHGLAIATVCKGLRQLVKEGLIVAVPRRGYRILPRGNGPAGGGSLAFVISEESMTAGWEPFYAAVEMAVKRAAGRNGWTVAWVTVRRDTVASLRNQLKVIGAWGIIVNSMDSDVLAVIQQVGIPVVMVDAWKHGVAFDAVVQDDFCGAELATRCLLDRGHRTFGWFGQVGETQHSRERFGGAITTLTTAGLSFKRLMEVAPRSPELAAKAEEFLSKPNRPSAILALWPSMAMAIANTARKMKLKTGRDFEMVGWCADEIYESTFIPSMGNMPLAATVVWSADTMAEAAIKRLIERRDNPGFSPLRLSVPARLRLSEKSA